MKKLLLIFAVLVGAAVAQDSRPRLELEPRLNLNGGGFQLLSGSMTAGTGMEEEHFSWHVFGTYNAAKKAEHTDLKDNTNPHGNIRVIGGRLWGRTSGGWLFGTSGSYAQLRTTNYSKVGWGIGVGGGHDWMHATCPNCVGPPTSLRLTVEYGLPLHKVDAEQGFTANFYVPSPVETGRHVFFHVSSFAGWIKTSPNGHYGHDGSGSIGVLFRF
jgi:hypothetical protein